MVVRGTTFLPLHVVRLATSPLPPTGTSMSGFVSPRLLALRALTLLGMSLEGKNMKARIFGTSHRQTGKDSPMSDICSHDAYFETDYVLITPTGTRLVRRKAWTQK